MRHRFVLLLGCLVLLTSGCLRGQVDLEVKRDGSGELRILEAVDESTLALIDTEDQGATLLVPRDLPPGMTAEPYRNAGFVGTELRARFEDLDQLAERMEDFDGVLADMADAAEGSLGDTGARLSLDQFAVARTPTGWYFEAAAMLPATAELPPATRAAADGLHVKVSVQLPGQALQHNADRVDGGRFAWNLTVGDRRQRLVAETTTVGGSRPPWGLLSLGLGLVAVAGAFGWIMLDERRRPSRRPILSSAGDGPRGAGGDGLEPWPATPPETASPGWASRDLPPPDGGAGATPVPVDPTAPPAAWPVDPPPGPPQGYPPVTGPAPPGAPPARPPDLPHR